MNDRYLTHFIWQFIQWKTSRFMELIHLRILTKLKRNPNQNFSTSSKKTHSEFVLVCNRRMDVLHWKKRSRSRNIDFSDKPNIMYFLLRRINFNYFFRCIYNLHHTYSEKLYFSFSANEIAFLNGGGLHASDTPATLFLFWRRLHIHLCQLI